MQPSEAGTATDHTEWWGGGDTESRKARASSKPSSSGRPPVARPSEGGLREAEIWPRENLPICKRWRSSL